MFWSSSVSEIQVSQETSFTYFTAYNFLRFDSLNSRRRIFLDICFYPLKFLGIFLAGIFFFFVFTEVKSRWEVNWELTREDSTANRILGGNAKLRVRLVPLVIKSTHVAPADDERLPCGFGMGQRIALHDAYLPNPLTNLSFVTHSPFSVFETEELARLGHSGLDHVTLLVIITDAWCCERLIN